MAAMKTEELFVLGLGILLAWSALIMFFAKPQLFQRFMAKLCCRRIRRSPAQPQPTVFTVPSLAHTDPAHKIRKAGSLSEPSYAHYCQQKLMNAEAYEQRRARRQTIGDIERRRASKGSLRSHKETDSGKPQQKLLFPKHISMTIPEEDSSDSQISRKKHSACSRKTSSSLRTLPITDVKRGEPS